MRVIIMGCGRVGEKIARLMVEDGHDVTVIDYNAEALARLGPDFKGRRVRGIGFDRTHPRAAHPCRIGRRAIVRRR